MADDFQAQHAGQGGHVGFLLIFVTSDDVDGIAGASANRNRAHAGRGGRAATRRPAFAGGAGTLDLGLGRCDDPYAKQG